MRGALPGLAFEQARRGVQQERQQRAVGLGEIEGAPGSPSVSLAIASSWNA